MTNRKNLKLQKDVFEKHNEKREELGLTWTQYLERCEYTGSEGVSPDAKREILERLDDLESELES